MDDTNDFAGGMFNLLNQLQGMEQSMGERSVEAEAGNGLVKVKANGKLRLESVKLDPKAIDPEDPAMLEALVLTAVNRALDKVREEMAQEMAQGLLGGNTPISF